MERVQLADTEKHDIHSKIIDDNFILSISLPKNYDGKKRYPVLFLTDADIFFGLVRDTIGLLRFGDEIPEIILAGVGYPEGADHLSLRSRDLTPTQWVGEEPCGGAPQFLSFILEELKPLITEQYSVLESDWTLAGDSYGGLFALYALFNLPEEFRRYIIGSPSIYWDDKVIFEQEKLLSQSKGSLNARVFLSAGELEAIREPAHAAMLSNTVRMAEILNSRDYKGLDLTTHIFPGETHLSVIPATFSRGLREVYQQPPVAK